MKIILALTTLLLLASCQSKRPTNIGLIEEPSGKKLTKCPETPNCLSSHYPEDKDHYVEPLAYKMPKSQAKELITSIIKKTPAAKLITNEPNYIYAEYTSALFKFVDDVEFDFSQDNVIHLRSASRLGRKDFGVNSKRIEEIKFRFYQNDM
jgi:uncharacterized protein (DUF1499 family)